MLIGRGFPGSSCLGSHQAHGLQSRYSLLEARFGGTGLGLVISKQLTELMGGRIWVSSEPCVGSVFQLEIPYQPAPPQKPPSVASKDWLNKRILVVDDNETNRLIVTSHLHRWKFTVQAASSAQEALQALRNSHWDAVLLDWPMGT